MAGVTYIGRKSKSSGVSRCNRCGEPVQWLPTKYGSSVALEQSPSDVGVWRISGGVAEKLVGIALDIAHADEDFLWERHPDDCDRGRGVPCPAHLRAQLGLPPLEERLAKVAESE